MFTTYTAAHGLTHSPIVGITSDEIGRVWVLATDSSILQLEGGRFVPTPIAARRIRFGPSQWDTSVFWGADDTRLYRFTRGRLMFIALPGVLRGIGIARAEQEEDGTIWIVTLRPSHREPRFRCPQRGVCAGRSGRHLGS